MIRFLDPRAKPGTPIEPYTLGIDLVSTVSAASVTVGLLANGFPDSVAFLDEVGQALRERLPRLRLEAYDKGNASIVAGDDLLAGITKECQAVVTAYGH